MAYEPGRRTLDERRSAGTLSAAIGGLKDLGDSWRDIGAHSRQGRQQRGRLGLSLGRLLTLCEMLASWLTMLIAVEEVMDQVGRQRDDIYEEQAEGEDGQDRQTRAGGVAGVHGGRIVSHFVTTGHPLPGAN